MSAERVKIEQVVPEAADCSDVFRRIPLNIRVGYEARIIGVLETAEDLCTRRWNSLRFNDILDYLDENPGPDGRHQYYSIAEDIVSRGYARMNGAKAALERVTKTSLTMLSYGVTSLEDLNQRQFGLAPGEMPRGVPGGIRGRI